MSAMLECPEIDFWPALLDESLSAEQREPLERHLEMCPYCQERIDRTQDAQDSLRNLGRQFGDPTIAPADPVLAQVRERLHEAKSPIRADQTEPADLSFLGPASKPDLLGMLRAYEVQSVIGEGGMGVVLKAFEPALNRVVAIKVMAPFLAGSATARKRFIREAHAAAAVSHDHVVAVHGVSEVAGLPYLVMQYIAGESLQARLDRTGPLQVEEIVRIGLQTAQGLAAAHAQGLIHRDVKPANLLLSCIRDAADGTDGTDWTDGSHRSHPSHPSDQVIVKITDFGLARMVDDVGLTQQGVVAGTPEYMAPEQARGEAVDHRADLFSLGSVLYALCTGSHPFHGSSAMAVLRMVSDEEPMPIRQLNPDVPAWLEAVIVRLMAKSPAERFQSAAEVAALLEGHRVHLRQPATSPEAVLPTRECQRRPSRSGFVSWFRQPGRWGVLLLPAAVGLLVGFLARTRAAGRVPADDSTAGPGNHLVFDFRTRIEDLPGLTLFGPEADSVAQTDAQGLRITLPEGRPDSNTVGVELPLRIRGNFTIDLGYELLAFGKNIPDPAAGVQMRLKFDSSSTPLVALARFRNRYPPQRVPLFQVVGHDGETFAAYRITILPNYWESPKGIDVRAAQPRGRLKLVRTGSELQYLVSDGDLPYERIQSEEVGLEDVKTVRLVAFSGWTPVAVDVRFTDLTIDADEYPDGIPGRMAWSNAWLTVALLVGLAMTFGVALLVVFLLNRRRRTPETSARSRK
jgi:serine/threonine protein kinase